MGQIKEFRKGEEIPEGSKFLRAEDRKVNVQVSYEPGFIFDTKRTTWDMETVFIYEVPNYHA